MVPIRRPSSPPGGRNVRLLRVGENIRHALAGILAREEIRDEALAGVSVTVSAVEVSPDLRQADVFVLPLMGRNAPDVVAALNRHAGFLRGELGRAVRIKYLPRLTFRLDASFAEAEHIENLLKSDKVRRDLEDGGRT